MRRLTVLIWAGAALLSLPALAPAAQPFGMSQFDVAFQNEDGSPAAQAGSHPYEIVTSFELNNEEDGGGFKLAELKDAEFEQIAGLVGNTSAVPRCSQQAFVEAPLGGNFFTKCPDESAIGYVDLAINARLNPVSTPEDPLPGSLFAPVFSVDPSPGVPFALGFSAAGLRIIVEVGVKQGGDYNVVATTRSTPQAKRVIGTHLTIWGVPADPRHDPLRGTRCMEEEGRIDCPYTGPTPIKPLITLPTTCDSPLSSVYRIWPWSNPLAPPVTGSVQFPGGGAPPAPLSGCDELGFGPTISSEPTTASASSSSGLDFSLDVDDPGLTDPDGNAQSAIKRTEVKLPEGFTVNPSIAQGLDACTVADLGREAADSAPGAGCPQASKLGTVEVETPLLEEPLDGTLYVAQPFENEFGSLLATYMVIKSAKYGILIKQGIHIVADEQTGQLTAVADDIPQLPFSHFRLHFRGGDRGPLTTPTTCGSHAVSAVLTPWSGGPAVTDDSIFEIASGAGGGACTTGPGAFAPGFEAGTLSPQAGAFSPFVLKLTRNPGSQRFSKIETTLPQGLLGRLAGVAECSDAQIAVAASRARPEQGALELAAPSCPAASEVGRVDVGAGSGSPTFVSGRAYLAGPYKGAPLSLAIITPAVTGPFDLGTVVVRTALYVNETTSQIQAVSDPLPTILQGIPLDVRSIALDMNRPNFTLNPTSCEPKSIAGAATSTLGAVTPLTQYFQVANCPRLGFKPKLKLSLKGATRRNGHPALKAVLTYPKQGTYANIGRAQVGLPHSMFLDQGNIGTVCTQPQLKARACPPASIYGRAKAWTPLLDKPLEGPVYLGVGYGHALPDLVADLNGQIRFLLNGKVDTTKQDGLRNTFGSVPDAPVSKFVLEMKGGKKKGLLVNSENLCRKPQRAAATFKAQNGKVLMSRPAIANDCGKKKKPKKKKAKRAGKGR
jgi:hypothetical protein